MTYPREHHQDVLLVSPNLRKLVERFEERLLADEQEPHSWPYDEVVREDRALLDLVKAELG